MMFIHTPFPNKVFALDLDTQKIVWRYEPRQDPSVIAQMCCDTVYRGLAYAEGKIFLQQADSTLVALDAKDGKVLWSVVNGDPKLGAVNTQAPHVFGDKVITGISGGEWGVRGFLAAYDMNTGKQVWKGYSVGPDEEMLFDPEKTMTWTDGELKPVGKDSSLKTWQGDQWKIGGGTTWGWFSWDPELNLVYYGTANPSTWNPSQRPGDNKWTMSIVARDLNTGVAKWVYQMTPHDEWDYDGVNEMILADIKVKGKDTKALVHFDRNGFSYTMDRTNGALLVAEKYDPTVNWASHVDMKTGRPQVVAKYSTSKFTNPEHGPDVNVKGICRRRSAPRTSNRPRSTRTPACSTCRPTTCAWTTSRSRSITLPASPTSVPRCRCIRRPTATAAWATSSPGTRAKARSCRPSPRSSRCGAVRSTPRAASRASARSRAT